MKKFLFILFFSIIVSTAYSQKVYFDRIERDGDRHIGAGKKEESLNDAKYNFSLTVFASTYEKQYYLLVSSLYTIDDDCVILLRLGNEDVKYLPINNAHKSQIDWPSAQPIYGSNGVSWAYGTQKADYYVGLFYLSDSDLNDIETHGIKKIRIKFYSKYFEKSWKKDKMGKYLKKCHEKIEEQLLKPHESSKSFFEDF